MLDTVVGVGKNVLMCQAELAISHWVSGGLGIIIVGLLVLLVTRKW